VETVAETGDRVEEEEVAEEVMAAFSGGQEEGEDAVLPFKLDSTFDYDNCPLTAKPWWACPPGKGQPKSQPPPPQ